MSIWQSVRWVIMWMFRDRWVGEIDHLPIRCERISYRAHAGSSWRKITQKKILCSPRSRVHVSQWISLCAESGVVFVSLLKMHSADQMYNWTNEILHSLIPFRHYLSSRMLAVLICIRLVDIFLSTVRVFASQSVRWLAYMVASVIFGLSGGDRYIYKKRAKARFLYMYPLLECRYHSRILREWSDYERCMISFWG